MAAIAQTCGRLRATTPPGTIALVPTMGALHGGHLALIKKARQLAKVVIVSIYVNPLQFAPNEDFADYPRGLAQDCAMIDDVADVIFAPDDKTMYPQQQTITLSLPPLAAELCGRTRPGFFDLMRTRPGFFEDIQLLHHHLHQPPLLIILFAKHCIIGARDIQQLANRHGNTLKKTRARAPA